jgi:hypothetical protein
MEVSHWKLPRPLMDVQLFEAQGNTLTMDFAPKGIRLSWGVGSVSMRILKDVVALRQGQNHRSKRGCARSGADSDALGSHGGYLLRGIDRQTRAK